ncbi:MAG: bifunctional UDP-N-acetylglucosamine diphosphorylase/glucosamine-1-phosphate N-acetyltransferase GlmU [Anaerolineae bacterium]|jgi:bifunctional UDP-N-acetylglucosamine pyrophosphorylase/glucosamine-1-phosphate N-acetyltransferase|nr:bifunctional UDP-N-acetylglucosamine diphosphorylase/glucosamine-1-phosphate N-acetyltransferase GlmU [Chloroflexota bacterium]
MQELGVVILAAGQGTRMRSKRNKVLHAVGGVPMIFWPLEAARQLGAERPVLVIGNDGAEVERLVGDRAQYAVQAERRGTAHALLQAMTLLEGSCERVLVLYGDNPTLSVDTLQRLLQLHADTRPVMTLLAVDSGDSMGFGRIVRDGSGAVREIVEEAVATPEQLAIRELNCGVYCFDAQWLWSRLPAVTPTPPSNEYYLTDMLALAIADGKAVSVLTIDDVSQVLGINNRVQLSVAASVIRQRVNQHWMLAGVTILDPASTFIDATVEIGQDTIILPNTHLQGQTVIGCDAVLGPNSVIRDSQIGDGCRVAASVVEGARMDAGSEVGPYGHLRPKAHLGEGVHMGNFGEVKDAYLAPGTKMGHFSYVGNAVIGEGTNIGAGTVTCNYDGIHKHTTTIGPGVFIGSGTMLVAPVTIGEGARLGAGSVVTRDVRPGALAYGVPARERLVKGDDDSKAS